MKKLLLIFTALSMLLSFSACSRKDDNPYDGEKLSYTEMLDGNGSVTKRWYYKYNIDGEISTSMRCTEDGTCVQRNEYTYTEDNLKASEIIYILGKKTSVTQYTYTEDKKLETETVYLPDSITTTTYEYNADGTEKSYDKRDSEGNLLSRKSYSYSADKLSSETFYDAYNNITGSILYTYEGENIKSKEYSGVAVSEYAKEVFTYEKNNPVKTVYYGVSGEHLYTDTAEYEGDRCIHKMRVDANNAIVYTWDAYYDSFLSLIG